MYVARLLAVLSTLALLILHNNWWAWEPDLTLVFGAIPFDFVYRILWVIASIGVLWLFIRGWWKPSE